MDGFLILISSPSGGGKTTIIHKILETDPEKFIYSVSATTRKLRPGEIHGKDYFFLTEKQFFEKVEKKYFLEWEEVHGYYYGTDSDFIKKNIIDGKCVLLDLDVNGSLRVAQNYEGSAITIFIAPPSVDELVKRLKKRNTDSEQEINKRLKRIPLEMKKSKQFDFVVANNKLSETVNNVIKIIEKAGG
ncbi:guanylate kinase [candidate division KSB1 bacterium]|nr:guanylate kinase [candidate division KSB1 bacterium]MBL7094484.1 guanylate kinase [candidate division KSB1 bacterium]